MKTLIFQSVERLDNLNEPLRQHRIHVHGLWLAVQSPYFRKLLYSSGMKETHDTEVHLKIPECEENAHLILIEAMYHNDVLNDKSVDELLVVLELAEKYDVKFVFKKCKYVLEKNATTFEIGTQIMHVIKVKHNFDDVEDLAATLQLVLADEFSPLDETWQSEKYVNLSQPSLKYLLSSDNLIVQSESTVFHALMHWMVENNIDPGSMKDDDDLLAVVRFKLVTIDYLYNVIKKHPIASKMSKFSDLYLEGMTYHAIPTEQKSCLDDQPQLRKKPERPSIQCTLVIKKDDFETASRKNTKLETYEFWACGYKMSVDLFPSRSHDIRPVLIVHNLGKESFVRLEFKIVSKKVSASTTFEQQYIFKLDSHRAECDRIDLSYSFFNERNNHTGQLFVIAKPQ